MGAGQPRADIALRARNWVWYCLVQQESLLSDDDLDRVFVQLADQDRKRPRTFARIRNMGSAPTDVRGYRRKTSVYAAVHSEENRRAGHFEHARRAFESPLWELLTVPDLSPDRIQRIIGSIVTARGLTRVDSRELGDLQAIVNDSDLVKAIGLSIKDTDCLTDVYLPQDLDAVAVLAALYRESLAAHELRRAVLLQDAIPSVCMHFIATWRPPDFLASLLLQLIDDRICGNIWLDEHAWAAATGVELVNMSKGGTETQRKREIRAFVRWYISRGRTSANRLSLPKAPVPALNWVREHHEMIAAYRRAVHDDSCKIGVMEDSFLEEERKIAVQLQEKADGLSAAFTHHLRTKFGDYRRPEVDLNLVLPPFNRFSRAAPLPPEKPERTLQEVLDRMDWEDKQLRKAAREANREARRRLVPKDAE